MPDFQQPTLALYDPENTRWAEIGGKVAQAMVSVNPADLGQWLKALRDVRGKLTAPLATIFRDKDKKESERILATSILADYASDQPSLLASLLMDSKENQFADLFKKLRTQQDQAVILLESELAKKSSPEAKDAVKDRLAQRQAKAAVALVRLGRPEKVWPLLKHSPDPSVRSYIVNWLKPLGTDPKALMAKLESFDHDTIPTQDEGQSRMDDILFHPETSVRRALILALGEYQAEELSPGEREPLVAKLLEVYRHDPDAGIHGAAEWTLRRWKQEEKLKAEVDSELKTTKDWGERRWYVNGQGQTFTIIIEEKVEFFMGSPADEPEHRDEELLHKRVIPRRFAIATKEMTVEQYWQFLRENTKYDDIASIDLKRYSPDPSGPMIFVTWYRAAAYCNWLSKKEGLPPEEWCYLPIEREDYEEGMKIPDNVLQRKGYRLPTEAEWEYACRAGAMTSRYYGRSDELLGQYACYQTNTRGDQAWPCGSLLPNDLGLFDMLGNVYEWCQDRYQNYQPGEDRKIFDRINISEPIINTHTRICRGGSFSNLPAVVRSATRIGTVQPSGRLAYIGFRPARTYP